jgi:hypothetical protein
MEQGEGFVIKFKLRLDARIDHFHTAPLGRVGRP